MIKVLVVDDSAVMRRFLGGVVSAQPDMELVAVAADPMLAIERIRLHSPDVITLDVEMPRMNGLDFLQRLMSVRPIPVLMISSLTRNGADTTLRALELGAVDFFTKPGNVEAFESSAQEIADKIRAAAAARVSRRPARGAAAPSNDPLRDGGAAPEPGRLRTAVRAQAMPPGESERLIAIGASTGGVEALRQILQEFPADMPPALIAQHMPAGFTESFARRLDAICAIGVKEAEDGEAARPGFAYIAPGGRHLLVTKRGAGYALRVTDDAPVNRHRPSIDPLFRSAAAAAGASAIGVMLTGMGGDGADAMRALRDSGAHTIAQDEASCVVYGMPKQAIAAGAVCEVLPLRDIAARLAELCR